MKKKILIIVFAFVTLFISTNSYSADLDTNTILEQGESFGINSFIENSKKYTGEFFKDIDISNDKIFVKDNKTFIKYLNKKIESIFKEHLDYWYNVFEENIPSPNLKIRKMKSRWGVCNTKNKNVTLNYELYRWDIKCLDYVIVHELSHFIHPNHSSNFWKLVSKYCPNYKEIRKEMRS